MIINPQIIKKGLENQYAILPYDEFLKMKEKIENYEDLIDLRKAKQIDSKHSGKSAELLLAEL